MKFRKYIKEESTGLGADGLSKARLKTLLYKETKKCTYNKLYKDSGWNGPQCIWDTFNKLNLNWHIKSSDYRYEKDKGVWHEGKPQMPNSKEWQFEIQWDSNKGRSMKLGGHVTAAGAGTVDDPLSRYDVNMVIW